MVAGYSQNGLPDTALDVFRQMVLDAVQPREISLVSVLGACSQLSALRLGKEAHCFALKGQLMKDSFVNCAIIDMYAKCGLIKTWHGKRFLTSYRIKTRHHIQL